MIRKPETTDLTESQAKIDTFKNLRSKKEKVFKILSKDLKQEMVEFFKENYGSDDANIKYFEELFDFVISKLKRDHLISTEGKAKEKKIIYSKKTKIAFNPVKASRIHWDTTNTVSSIFDFVNSDKHFLPSFQRSTAWKSARDYQELALSIFRSVPLGIMYFWNINKDDIIAINHKKFKNKVDSKNPEQGFEDVGINDKFNGNDLWSVIDGQQRITGINILFNGTFNEKQMCFNEEVDDSKMFSFRKPDPLWVSLHEIFNKLNKIREGKKLVKPNEKELFFQSAIKELSEEIYITEESLKSFYKGIFEHSLVAICELPSGDLQEILQIFIRTNSFGKKLSAADIMKSSIVGDDPEMRNRIDDLISSIKKWHKKYTEASALKLMATYFTGEPKSNYSTFLANNKKYDQEWSNSKVTFDVTKDESWDILDKSINSFKSVLDDLSLQSYQFKSNNSFIPIIMWIAMHEQGKNIDDENIKKGIYRYLLLSNTLGYFSSSTDQKLKSLIKNIGEYDYFTKIDIGSSENENDISRVVEEIRNLNYQNDKTKIKFILSLNEEYKKSYNSIEHLKPQSQNGSHNISNLALLPSRINSLIKDEQLKHKVKLISDKMNITESRVLSILLLDDPDNISYEERLRKISKNILKNTSR